MMCVRSICRRNSTMLCAKCAFARAAPARKRLHASASDRGNIVKYFGGNE
jgi:hypothetical protein